MNVALILSGGMGRRMGSEIPKQYIEVGEKPIISYCIETLSKHPRLDALQIVAEESWRDPIWKYLKTADVQGKFRGFSEPGENRQLSIYHGLEDIRCYAGDEGYVLIHDAARPLLGTELISDCFQGVLGHDGLMPVLPMKDTVYSSLDGLHITSLLDRSAIYAGQAPEIFRIGKYYEANRRLLPDRIRKISGSTEPAVLYGMDVVMIHGDEKNFKITTKADLERFCRILRGQNMDENG